MNHSVVVEPVFGRVKPEHVPLIEHNSSPYLSTSTSRFF